MSPRKMFSNDELRATWRQRETNLLRVLSARTLDSIKSKFDDFAAMGVEGLSAVQFISAMIGLLGGVMLDKLEFTIQLLELFQAVDVNGDRTLEWEELLNYVVQSLGGAGASGAVSGLRLADRGVEDVAADGAGGSKAAGGAGAGGGRAGHHASGRRAAGGSGGLPSQANQLPAATHSYHPSLPVGSGGAVGGMADHGLRSGSGEEADTARSTGSGGGGGGGGGAGGSAPGSSAVGGEDGETGVADDIFDELRCAVDPVDDKQYVLGYRRGSPMLSVLRWAQQSMEPVLVPHMRIRHGTSLYSHYLIVATFVGEARVLATCTRAGMAGGFFANFYDFDSGALRSRVPVEYPCLTITYSAVSKSIVFFAAATGYAYLFDVYTLARTRTATVGTGPVHSAVPLSPSTAEATLVGTSLGTIELVDERTWRVLPGATVLAHEFGVRAMAYSPRYHRLVSIGHATGKRTSGSSADDIHAVLLWDVGPWVRFNTEIRRRWNAAVAHATMAANRRRHHYGGRDMSGPRGTGAADAGSGEAVWLAMLNASATTSAKRTGEAVEAPQPLLLRGHMHQPVGLTVCDRDADHPHIVSSDVAGVVIVWDLLLGLPLQMMSATPYPVSMVGGLPEGTPHPPAAAAAAGAASPPPSLRLPSLRRGRGAGTAGSEAVAALPTDDLLFNEKGATSALATVIVTGDGALIGSSTASGKTAMRLFRRRGVTELATSITRSAKEMVNAQRHVLSHIISSAAAMPGAGGSGRDTPGSAGASARMLVGGRPPSPHASSPHISTRPHSGRPRSGRRSLLSPRPTGTAGAPPTGDAVTAMVLRHRATIGLDMSAALQALLSHLMDSPFLRMAAAPISGEGAAGGTGAAGTGPGALYMPAVGQRSTLSDLVLDAASLIASQSVFPSEVDASNDDILGLGGLRRVPESAVCSIMGFTLPAGLYGEKRHQLLMAGPGVTRGRTVEPPPGLQVGSAWVAGMPGCGTKAGPVASLRTGKDAAEGNAIAVHPSEVPFVPQWAVVGTPYARHGLATHVWTQHVPPREGVITAGFLSPSLLLYTLTASALVTWDALTGLPMRVVHKATLFAAVAAERSADSRGGSSADDDSGGGSARDGAAGLAGELTSACHDDLMRKVIVGDSNGRLYVINPLTGILMKQLHPEPASTRCAGGRAGDTSVAASPAVVSLARVDAKAQIAAASASGTLWLVDESSLEGWSPDSPSHDMLLKIYSLPRLLVWRKAAAARPISRWERQRAVRFAHAPSAAHGAGASLPHAAASGHEDAGHGGHAHGGSEPEHAAAGGSAGPAFETTSLPQSPVVAVAVSARLRLVAVAMAVLVPGESKSGHDGREGEDESAARSLGQHTVLVYDLQRGTLAGACANHETAGFTAGAFAHGAAITASRRSGGGRGSRHVSPSFGGGASPTARRGLPRRKSSVASLSEMLHVAHGDDNNGSDHAHGDGDDSHAHAAVEPADPATSAVLDAVEAEPVRLGAYLLPAVTLLSMLDPLPALVSGHEDGTIRVWALPPAALPFSTRIIIRVPDAVSLLPPTLMGAVMAACAPPKQRSSSTLLARADSVLSPTTMAAAEQSRHMDAAVEGARGSGVHARVPTSVCAFPAGFAPPMTTGSLSEFGGHVALIRAELRAIPTPPAATVSAPDAYEGLHTPLMTPSHGSGSARWAADDARSQHAQPFLLLPSVALPAQEGLTEAQRRLWVGGDAGAGRPIIAPDCVTAPDMVTGGGSAAAGRAVLLPRAYPSVDVGGTVLWVGDSDGEVHRFFVSPRAWARAGLLAVEPVPELMMGGPRWAHATPGSDGDGGDASDSDGATAAFHMPPPLPLRVLALALHTSHRHHTKREAIIGFQSHLFGLDDADAAFDGGGADDAVGLEEEVAQGGVSRGGVLVTEVFPLDATHLHTTPHKPSLRKAYVDTHSDAQPWGPVWEGSWRAHGSGDVNVTSLRVVHDTGIHALLSAGNDGLARLWDAEGRLLGTLEPRPQLQPSLTLHRRRMSMAVDSGSMGVDGGLSASGWPSPVGPGNGTGHAHDRQSMAHVATLRVFSAGGTEGSARHFRKQRLASNGDIAGEGGLGGGVRAGMGGGG
jgi:WD40 repeat protein